MPPLQIDKTKWRSPNHNARNERVRSLVLHTCEGSLPHPRESSLPWLCSRASEVSCHYYVCRDATVFQLVDDDQEAWHAGVSQLSGLTGWKAFSIGIELEHHEGQGWLAVQKAALAALCQSLIQQYTIAQGLIVAHRWIAVPAGRRHDPTDFSDPDLKRWIAALYAPPPPAPNFYRLSHTQAVFEAPSPRGPVALNGTAEITEGERVEIDDERADGYYHLSNGLGFLPAAVLEKL